MKFTKPCATLEETLAFCNAVREAGGGNPLDALMPATPSDVGQCLIAKNLNFNCGVGTTHFRGRLRWAMVMDSIEVRNAVAEKLKLATVNLTNAYFSDWGQEGDSYRRGELYAVILPHEIGAVAVAFDTWIMIVDRLGDDSFDITEPERQIVKDFTPYIDASIKEAYDNGTFNDKGELLL